MKNTARGRRLLSLLTSLVMLLSMVSMPALALEDWMLMSITLTWMDEEGNPGMVNAVPVTWSQDQSFWAQVDASAPLDQLTISLYHPDHAYTFDPADGSQLTDVVNAGSGMDVDALIPIQAFENDMLADIFSLYISTEIMPDELPEDVEELPSESDPAQATVDVLYQDVNGNLLDSAQLVFTQGEDNYVRARPIDGYVPLEPKSISVMVDGNGIATPNPVIFYYEVEYVAPAQTTVEVQYQDINGNVLYTDQVTVVEGGNKIDALDIDGYTVLEPATVNVTVDSFGHADPNPVIFYYEEIDVEPAQTTVEIQFQDVNGNLLGDDHAVVFENETNAITAPAIDGYTALEPAVINVNVDSDGNASPNPVIFYYEQDDVAPAQATVDVQYQDVNGNVLGSDQVTVVEEEDNAITAPAIDGYTALEPAVINVSVDSDGNAAPNPVIFYYEENVVVPDQVKVDILHQDMNGVTLRNEQMVLEQGSINLATAMDIEGYTAVEPTVVEVVIGADGMPSPNPVVFFYEQEQIETPEIPAAPGAAKITIRYVDETTGMDVASAQTMELADGLHMITAAPENLPANYEPVTEPNVAVTVTGGVADQPEVLFIYRYVAPQPEEPVFAQVTVLYHDRQGKDIIPPQTMQLPGGRSTVIVPDATLLPADYAPVEAEPVSVNVDMSGVADRDTVIFVYKHTPAETPIPVGEMINRFGKTNTKQVVFRDGPSTKDKSLGTLKKGTAVWMIQEEINDNGVNWTRVYINKREAYIMSKYLDVMSQEDSDAYEAENLATPVPDFSAPTATPVPPKQERPTPTPYVEPETTDAPADDTEHPAGTAINRFGKTNTKQVVYREGPSTKHKSLGTLKKGTAVWMMEEIVNENGVKWTQVLVNGSEAYIMSKYLDAMSQADSDAYAEENLATPLPEMNGGSISQATPTPEITAEPEETDPPADDVEVPVLEGYVLTTARTALRTEVSNKDETIIYMLKKETLLEASGQTIARDGTVWAFVTGMDNQQGFVLQEDLRALTAAEAAYYLAQWENSNPTATPTAAPTPEPPIQRGYAYTIGDGVYFRSMPSTMSDIKNVLARDIVVYVENQQYVEGVAWHIVRFDNEWGYIRADLLRMMSAWEEMAYLNSLTTTTPSVDATPQPFDEDALSSYGYVSAKTVNFRRSASTSSAKIKTLKQYAFCLILGTEVVDGDVWYRVNYNGDVGYIHSNYFKQMTVAEFEDFYGSEEYLQGVKNNTTAQATAVPNGGNGIVSPEDQTVNTWTNPNNGLNVSYEPFDPFATPEPIATPETTIPLEPVPTTSIAPLPSPQATMDVIYPQEDVEHAPSSLGWIIGVLIVVILVGGGAYGYVIYNRNKKQLEARKAAARRQAQQRPSGPESRPYARPASQPQQRQPYPPQAQQARRPYPSQGDQQPYTPQQKANPQAAYTPPANRGSQQNPYARPVNGAHADNTPYRRPEPRQEHPADDQPTQHTYTASFRDDSPVSPAPRRRRTQSTYMDDDSAGA